MKGKKKGILAFLLAFVMVATIVTPVLADEGPTPPFAPRFGNVGEEPE